MIKCIRRNLHLFQLLAICFLSSVCFSQNEVIQVTKKFDSIVGKENLALNNGTFHIDQFRVINGKHQYYGDGYMMGNVTYNGRDYFDVELKYDLYDDMLVLKPNNSAGGLGIDLIKDRVQGFVIDGRTFLNLNKILPQEIKEDLSGFFELYQLGDKFIFYIKHIKRNRKKQDKDIAYYEFNENHDYLLFYNGKYHEISSKADIAKLFPEQKDLIDDFFDANKELEDSDEVNFYKNLFFKIYSSKNPF